MGRESRSDGERPRVVIVGAGFGGLNAARALAGGPVEVRILDRNNYHTFQPLLYQVATAALEPEEIAHAVRGIFQGRANVDFRLGRVTGVDFAGRRVLLAEGPPEPYDYLVLAPGATTDPFGVEGVEEHAFSLKTLEEAVALRAHVIRLFEAANVDPRRVEEGFLNFVLVGGGPTGVEMAGALVELFRLVLAEDFPNLDVARARVILVEMRPALLFPYDEALRRYTREVLEERGVEVMLERAVARVSTGAVHFKDGEVLPTRTVVWAAGVQAVPLAERLGLSRTRGGRLRVEADLSLPGRPEVFVVGDLAASTDEEGELHPQLAPVAVQAGRHAAGTILRRLRREPPRPFRYKDRGTMATIGRGAAVAELGPGIRLKGFPAWLAWAFLHLLMLVGFRNRLNVYVNWVWNFFTYDRGARLILGSGRAEARSAPAPSEEAAGELVPE